MGTGSREEDGEAKLLDQRVSKQFEPKTRLLIAPLSVSIASMLSVRMLNVPILVCKAKDDHETCLIRGEILYPKTDS